MPDLFMLMSRWWKMIVGLTLLVTAMALLILLLQPKEYLSTVTALPASGFASDKAMIFNNNIQELYPSLGTTDDLDRVVGTGKLDTLYLAVAKEKDLASRWGLPQAPLLKVAHILKDNTRVEKSEYGELKVKVWDRNPQFAAELANVFFDKLQALHQELQSQGNALVLEKLTEQYNRLRNSYAAAPDSDRRNASSVDLAAMRKKNLQEQILQYEKLIAEYSLMLQTNPQALLVVEAARPAIKADKPRVVQTLLLTVFASLVFGLLLAVGLQSRK